MVRLDGERNGCADQDHEPRRSCDHATGREEPQREGTGEPPVGVTGFGAGNDPTGAFSYGRFEAEKR